jgi:hypothetical protein
MNYIPQQTMKEIRLGLMPPVKKLCLVIPSKLENHGYHIAMPVNVKSGSAQIFHVFICTK